MMNEKAIAEVVMKTEAAVEAAKARGETQLNFADFYLKLKNVSLEMDEKDEVKKRLAAKGWRLENAWIGDGEMTLEQHVVLHF
jgi:hypothetical protein